MNHVKDIKTNYGIMGYLCCACLKMYTDRTLAQFCDHPDGIMRVDPD